MDGLLIPFYLLFMATSLDTGIRRAFFFPLVASQYAGTTELAQW